MHVFNKLNFKNFHLNLIEVKQNIPIEYRIFAYIIDLTYLYTLGFKKKL